MATVPRKQMLTDLAHMCGGNFTPDSLSPAVHDSILKRARENAKRYIQAIGSVYLGANFDASLQSNMDLPYALKLLAEGDAVAARNMAGKLLSHFDAVLVVYDQASDRSSLMGLLPDSTVSMFERLDRHRLLLRRLLEEVETP